LVLARLMLTCCVSPAGLPYLRIKLSTMGRDGIYAGVST
jgi:hypothetical protein